MSRFLVVLTLVCSFLPQFSLAQEGGARWIAVEGIGRVFAVPDVAVVRLGVQREARDAGAAMAAASAAMAGMLAGIAEAGIAPEDVQPERVGLDPRWRHMQDGSPPRITGYVATNSLRVTVRDLDGLGTLLDAVVSDGANTMDSLTFEVSELSDLEDEARAKAVEDARRKASILAGAASAELGHVISISEGAQPGAPMPMFETALAERSSVPVAVGQMDVTIAIRAVFALAD